MPSRALGRNVHIYSARDTNTVLGGLVATDGMTNANFYSMVEIVFIFDNDYTLSRKKSGTTVQRDNDLLQAGKYIINTAGSLKVNNEPWLVRTIRGLRCSPKEFCKAVRERDYGYVITGQPALNVEYGYWDGYTATPIFPLTHEQHWVTHGYDKWITVPGARGSISSVQNRMLLRDNIATHFEGYMLSINSNVSMTSIFLGVLTTNHLLRAVTRSSPSSPKIRALLIPISIRSSLGIPNDPLINSSAGTPNLPCLWMLGGKESNVLIPINLLVWMWFVLVGRKLLKQVGEPGIAILLTFILFWL